MDRFIAIVIYFRQFMVLHIFTIYLRYLIGGAFVIAAFGMGKFSNQELLISSPGASIEKLEPIQQFFRVMSTSGMYWNFIGWSQVIAGLLLMTQRFAKLGAAIFFGLILNIFVITLSFNFRGTPVVTGLMLLATTYLILWDFDSFQFMFRKPKPEHLTLHASGIIDRNYWAIVGLLMFFVIIGCYAMGFHILYQLSLCVVLGFVSFVLFFTTFNKNRTRLTT
jgi:hypothetical protein